eukprot:CAMPEP_0119193904 /NCGR_PEP_ID=MMETSP1316-20130426/3883_1 /TAXON_ID=41880 /ORGANISM="Pycnococcus provasolii, Strain RCC2336" /LENGTH=55 /DNA_ID=CAMNT_0007189195 /DNA_START=117 /DNA_END=281 /DNA_ORIENTATION=-
MRKTRSHHHLPPLRPDRDPSCEAHRHLTADNLRGIISAVIQQQEAIGEVQQGLFR